MNAAQRGRADTGADRARRGCNTCGSNSQPADYHWVKCNRSPNKRCRSPNKRSRSQSPIFFLY